MSGVKNCQYFNISFVYFVYFEIKFGQGIGKAHVIHFSLFFHVSSDPVKQELDKYLFNRLSGPIVIVYNYLRK